MHGLKEVSEQTLVLEEVLEQVSVLGWVSEEVWCMIEGYLEEKQLTQLSST